MGKRGYAFYVSIFIVLISTMAVFQFYDNTYSPYPLRIEYEIHTCSVSGSGMFANFDHSYSTVTIDIEVSTTIFIGSISGLSVGGFPFWVDISSWNPGDVVTIGGAEYELSLQGGRWKAHRDFSDSEYENLYFHGELGIFVESYTDCIILDEYALHGYSEDIQIQESNLAGLYGRVTGSNVLLNIGLVTGIFVELAVIYMFLNKRPQKPFS